MKDQEFLDRVEPMRGKLYAIAYSYFGSESMAVDAVDEAIYKGYLKKRQLKQPEFFETWLVRILINVCNGKYKHYKKQVGIEEIPEEASLSEVEGIPLKEAIRKLPEKYREVILLKFFGGYTLTEICSLTGNPQGTVATRLRKALEILRIEMEVEE
ncbi:MAG: sigma-70 family RNA polymerase sigma factor [Lachnospiraceae bacterium]|jgi:RNA polymerase sigma-70 factor (ECF subfamily)|nr:sigma-70 family RNA polymerase sigma factor [Lachnospiraceae bacterium]SFQ20683.1 RNA polymerase sigma-70 factor, ECF subfamily [Lachnospiraceae bacterium XBB1006]